MVTAYSWGRFDERAGHETPLAAMISLANAASKEAPPQAWSPTEPMNLRTFTIETSFVSQVPSSSTVYTPAPWTSLEKSNCAYTLCVLKRAKHSMNGTSAMKTTTHHGQNPSHNKENVTRCRSKCHTVVSDCVPFVLSQMQHKTHYTMTSPSLWEQTQPFVSHA